MDIKLETIKLRELQDNIELLKSTKTLHPLVISKLINTNKILADKKENFILNELSR